MFYTLFYSDFVVYKEQTVFKKCCFFRSPLFQHDTVPSFVEELLK